MLALQGKEKFSMMLRFVDPDEHEETIEDLLLEENPEAVLFEEFADCLMGLNRGADLPVAVYDYWACLDVLVANGMEYWNAIQNLQDRALGKNQPIFVQLPQAVGA